MLIYSPVTDKTSPPQDHWLIADIVTGQDSHHKTHRQCSQIAQRVCAQDYIIVTGRKSPSTHDRQLRRWWCWHLRNFNLPVSLNWVWMPWMELGFQPNSFILSGCLFPPPPLPLFFNLHFLWTWRRVPLRSCRSIERMTIESGPPSDPSALCLISRTTS